MGTMLNQTSFTGEITYFRNLDSCILDALQAAQDKNVGPSEPTNFSILQKRLEACQLRHPPLYRENVIKPYVSTLNMLGEAGFSQVLSRDPSREGEACLMLDIAQAILLHGEEDYNKKATDALQEVVSDLYDGFLSAEDRRDIKPPDIGIVAPLVKWGNSEDGPYTWPVDSTIDFGVKAAIVNLPIANAQRGIFAWATLGHESAGHNIINADTGLRQELRNCLWNGMQNANVASLLPDYWASRIDETASDVLGILNMGPAAGIALIGYFRALNAAGGREPQLRNIGPSNDPHPADILRGYLAASTVSLLNFSKANRWATAIEAETDKDLARIQLGENSVITPEEAKDSALIAANCLVQTKMECLGNHALGEIQNWHDDDENIVRQVRSILKATEPLPEIYSKDVYAAHVVAAAIVESLQGKIEVPMLFTRMINMLKTLHDKNPSWGSLYVKYPGNVVPLNAYLPFKKS
ncbi:MAG: hypothetical protein WCW68_01020 [Methanothrix sp.]|jgi:hypothetical protein